MTLLDLFEFTELTSETLAGRLRIEFDRLNAAHFGGRLTCPEIVISRRKTYGGYYQPQKHRIVLSWQAYQEHGWDETVNTFRHEVAHIVHRDHSAAFWTLARTLGVVRRYAAAPVVPARTSYRYVYACPVCGRRVHRHRRMRRPASCGICDKRFNPRYALCLLTG